MNSLWRSSIKKIKKLFHNSNQKQLNLMKNPCFNRSPALAQEHIQEKTILQIFYQLLEKFKFTSSQ
ncbi:hypothetical protein BpHYR1_010227 [Brachionus plicatilis]|uniref:Uncharacterized protein n=1 Tax=Brachionus plicatilis TaxID=10195 RepID=A0A3M7Q3X7_BRAPC|nr:hypothetical protein BpHYR1_010227 [Brachionus plicatilis]